jgi:hypothetical protein
MEFWLKKKTGLFNSRSPAGKLVGRPPALPALVDCFVNCGVDYSGWRAKDQLLARRVVSKNGW